MQPLLRYEPPPPEEPRDAVGERFDDFLEPGFDLPAKAAVKIPRPKKDPSAQARGGRQRSRFQEQSEFESRYLGDFERASNIQFPRAVASTPAPLNARTVGDLGGSDFADFMDAVADHPTKFATVSRENLHPESRRAALPMISKNRTDPPQEFLTKYGSRHGGFLLVENLPHPVVEGDGGDELGEFEDVMARQGLCEAVAKIMGVSTLDVSPASMTSAFICFPDHSAAEQCARDSKKSRLTMAPLTLSSVEGDSVSEAKAFFDGANVDSMVTLGNIVPGTTAASIARNLFPENLDIVRDLKIAITPEDVRFTSPKTAFIRLPSPDATQSLVQSAEIIHHLSQMGRHHVKVYPAKRSKISDGYQGPVRGAPQFKHGPKLEVLGDAPSKDFFLSHSAVLHLRNLSPQVSKKDLTDFFQPFSLDYRDVNGSIELGTDIDGFPSGRAFVGFDLPGEAESVLEKFASGRAEIGKSTVTMRLVKEHILKRGRKADRPVPRTEEELLDELHNWEKHVDTDDIKELESLGISKDVLEDIFLTVRYKNRSLGATDQARAGDRLRPEYRQGDHYRRFVKLYLKILKEVTATPENPGLLYESLFLPGQEVDLSIFESEKERIEGIRKLK